jgi:PAS domain S-box-containing protein
MASPELSGLSNAYELKRTEEALRISEEKFSKAFKTSPDALNINRLSDGVYLEINPGFTAITGYTADDVIGRSSLPEELGIWVDQKDRDRMVAGLKARGEIIGLEAPFRMKNGQIRIGMMSARVLEISGEPCILSTTRDITEQKKAELSTLASEQKYRELANSVPVGIFESDCAGKLTFANAILFEWFGYSEAEFRAGLSLVELVSPFDRARVRENVARVLSRPRPLTNEYELTRKSGATFPVLTITRRICDQERIVGIRGILLDLTEKKKMEFAMQNMAKLDSLGVLAGGIAHDFNNLLAGIFGNIDLARSVSKEPEALEYLRAIMGSMGRARALTQQLLTFAKGGSPVRKITPLVPFIQETVQFALSGSTVSYRFFMANSLWPCNIDKNQIGQVLDNIVINAQQAMPSGGTIDITAENVFLEEGDFPGLSKGVYVKVSIKDTGIGIPKEIMPRIFDPFYTTKTKGHGLGLATSYSIINRHGGCITVDSEPGKGSAFHVFLPASVQGVNDGLTDLIAHSGRGRVLIMDDEEAVRASLGKILESFGYNVVGKADGQEVLDFFRSETAALRPLTAMVFDLTVPGGMGGVETLAEIRKLNKEIPVFVVSGYADNSVMKNPVRYGFAASICKPFTMAELSETLHKHLTGPRGDSNRRVQENITPRPSIAETAPRNTAP